MATTLRPTSHEKPKRQVSIPIWVALIGAIGTVVGSLIMSSQQKTEPAKPAVTHIRDSHNDNRRLSIKDSFNQSSLSDDDTTTINEQNQFPTEVKQGAVQDITPPTANVPPQAFSPAPQIPVRQMEYSIPENPPTSPNAPSAVPVSMEIPPSRTTVIQKITVQEMIQQLRMSGYIVEARPATPEYIAENQGLSPDEALLLDTLKTLLTEVREHEARIQQLETALNRSYQRTINR